LKILIFGSEGFIGAHLVRYFLSKGEQVYGCDLFETATLPYHYLKMSRLSPALEEVFTVANYDVCINASGSGNVNYSMTHPFSDFEANSLDTIRVLDCIRRLQPACRYIHLSSAAVYGNPEKLPVQETDSTRPLSPYGWHKLIAENICHEYTSIYNLQTAILRPFSVFGPHLKKQLFWDLYIKCKSSTANAVALWGTGRETRDFIYITDLVLIIDLLIQKAPMRGEIYNVAEGKETSIAGVAELFKSELFPAVDISFNQQVRDGDPLNWRADISRIQSLGFKQTVSFRQGIENLIQWLRSLS
jgi:dTDP-glucose 4,6-dehydratase/UDP-glucose 4-epimerase